MEKHPQPSKTGDEKGLEESFMSEIEGMLTVMSEEIKTYQDGDIYCIEIPQKDLFDKWMLSLKLRYWLDLGGRDNYDVAWLRKIDDNSTLEEILINIKKFDTSEASAGSIPSENLFSIKAIISKMKLLIEGKFIDIWKRNEYQKLICLVSKLCLCPDVNQETAGELYTNEFYCQSVPDHIINLDNVSLDVYADSDSEDDPRCQEPEEIVNETPKKVKPPGKQESSRVNYWRVT
ncbi:Hypothetical predicted protein [Paramuricea clavata]|uniref:Uncharacterized protein n=1 Tax=Paramuricea clavata TaxID=317549 RepID=A0A7D9DYL9_PARCT|nr:Hypothetical predicted protein [Paramuricea clavata]